MGEKHRSPPASTAGWPPLSRTEEQLLVSRLEDGDPLAPNDVAAVYLDALAGRLERAYPRANTDDCNLAAVTAIENLLKNPTAYDPNKKTLAGYLDMAARKDLSSIWSKESRHHKRTARIEAVEISPAMQKYLWDTSSDPALVVERKEEFRARFAAANRAVPARALEGLTPTEIQVWHLMREGERRTERYAAVLGIEHLPRIAQQRQVYRVKDKITKRVQRAGGER